VDGSALVGLLLAGLLGSGHCFGMCGGIAGSFALAGRGRSAGPPLGSILATNLGRIATYTALGAVAGTAGAAAAAVLPPDAGPRVARIVAALCFLALALYLAGIPALVAPIERLGGRLWRRVAPAFANLLGRRSLAGRAALGAVWGLLPCGLVYTSMIVAGTRGTALGGALGMLAFGLGTLPALVAAGLASSSIARLARAPWARRAAAVVYLAAAVWLVARPLPPSAVGSAPACHDTASGHG
jgi:sulfite exporter TauE/SafE